MNSRLYNKALYIICISATFLTACTDSSIPPLYSEVRGAWTVKWSADSKNFFALWSIPTGESNRIYRISKYDNQGQKLKEYPNIYSDHDEVPDFYLTQDERTVIVAGYYHIEIFDLETSNKLQTINDMVIMGKSRTSDNYLLMNSADYSFTNRYKTFYRTTLDHSGTKEHSSVRIHCFNNYSWGLSFIVSGERVITVEYDSSNHPVFVARDSLLQSMYSYEFPEALGYSKPIVPITGDFVLFSQLRTPMRLNIKTGIVDSTIPPNVYSGQADLSRDGVNVCYVAASNSGLFFYNSSSATATKIIDGPSKGYLHSLVLSPDDKHVAYIYSPGYYSDDQIVVAPTP